MWMESEGGKIVNAYFQAISHASSFYKGRMIKGSSRISLYRKEISFFHGNFQELLQWDPLTLTTRCLKKLKNQIESLKDHRTEKIIELLEFVI